MSATAEKKGEKHPKITYLPFTKGHTPSGQRPRASEETCEFVIDELGDDEFLVNGVDAVGNQVDISKLATLTVTSSDPKVISSSVIAPMKFALSPGGGKEGSAELTLKITWNDSTWDGPHIFEIAAKSEKVEVPEPPKPPPQTKVVIHVAGGKEHSTKAHSHAAHKKDDK